MASLSFDKFENIFKEHQKYQEIKIRYTKQRGNDIIHKDIIIKYEDNKYTIKELERNQTKNIEIVNRNNQELTSDSLKNKHGDIAILFRDLDKNPAKKRTIYEDFKRSDSKLKWLARNLLLDTRLIGGIVGHIIAYSANKENPHYKTIPSSILGNTLGPLIFPGGYKKPIKDKAGVILIDSILYKQYKSFRNYQSKYERDENEIVFSEKKVKMNFCGSDIKLDTIIGSSKIVNDDDKEHLHVIYFNGNSGCYQQDYKMVAEDLIAYGNKDIKATAIQFNYPGILNSEGQVSRAQDLIDAGVAQVNELIKEGVPHDKIVLHGVSLGGSIASHVAAHFHKLPKSEGNLEKQTLGGIYASRTFASTAQVGRDFFNRALGDNIISRTISTLCLPFIKLGTWGSEWDLDTGKAFFSLPRQKRDYSVVLSPKANRKKYRKENSGGFVQQLTNLILRKRIAPADDEILRRGLHSSWEKLLDSFLTKSGRYGPEAKNNYVNENHRRKMMVVNFSNQNKPTLCPKTDGHAKANYCFFENNTYKRPNKESKHFGLVHRSKNKADELSVNGKALKYKNNEASEVARESIAAMVIPQRR